MIRRYIQREGRVACGSDSHVIGRETLLRGWVYLKIVISALRGRISSRGRSMVVTHRRRSAVADVLAHNLQGFSEQVEAAPRGGADGVFTVRPVAYPPGVIRASFSKQSIAGTQQMLSYDCVLGELGVTTAENDMFRARVPTPLRRNCAPRVLIAYEAWGRTHA